MKKVKRNGSYVFMIISLVMISVAVRSVGESKAQTTATADETAIRKMIEDQVAAWSRGDAAA